MLVYRGPEHGDQATHRVVTNIDGTGEYLVANRHNPEYQALMAKLAFEQATENPNAQSLIPEVQRLREQHRSPENINIEDPNL